MRAVLIAVLVLLGCLTCPGLAAEAPLQSLVGDWTMVSEFRTEPGGPLQRTEGTATGRAVGGPWTMLETHGVHFGQTYTGVLTIGLDAETKDYVATWIDSLSANVVNYRGSYEEPVLTLHAKVGDADFREVVEFKGPDQIVWTTLTGSTTVVTIHFSRRK